MNPIYYSYADSPLGPLLLCGDGAGLSGLYMTDQKYGRAVGPGWRRNDLAFQAARRQLGEYFDGRRRRFDLPLRPAGTPFQRAVWQALLAIPYGSTRSYGELARLLGRPAAARAVGAANAKNPLGILVPCHRVLGCGGALTGYAGGAERKRWLLDHEARQLHFCAVVL